MKGKKQSNGSGQQLEETLTRLLFMFKKKCEVLGIVPNLSLKLSLQNALQLLKYQEIKTTQMVGPIQIRALMQTLIDIKYAKIKRIDIWKAKMGDQGLRNICRYLQSRQNNVVEVLDVLQNQITSLGCQFLGKVFTLPFTRILKLKLDDNLIGNKGLQNLSIGLRTNTVLTKLSLKYCGIDQKGVSYLQDILANLSTKIRSIKVQGNPLGNKGIYQLLKVIQLNQMLQKVNIADTKLNLLDFKAKNQYVIDQDNIEQQNQQQQEADEQNPQKKQNKQAPNLQNVKQVILPKSQQNIEQKKQPQKVEPVVKQIKQQKKKQHLKITKSISEQDKSLSADIMRILSGIMRYNLLIRKYDLRFNPISDDAALILFQIIQQNIQIKDVQINNNVDNALRQNLDTLMRKRTGRLPKGRRGKGKKSKKKKK